MGTIDVRFEPELDLTVYTVRGTTAADQIVDAIRTFYEGPPSRRVLWNLTEGDLSGIDSTDVAAIAEVPQRASAVRQGGRTALVAPDELGFGMSRMFDTLSDLRDLPFETRAFRDEETARNWLLEDN